MQLVQASAVLVSCSRYATYVEGIQLGVCLTIGRCDQLGSVIGGGFWSVDVKAI